MSNFAEGGVPMHDTKDLSPIPPELELYARIEVSSARKPRSWPSPKRS